MKNINNNFNIFLFDLISKFNFYNNNNIVKINKLKIFVKLKSIDPLFFKNFLFLSKIFFELFYRKIFILKILNDQNKIKNSVIFYVGFSENNILLIFNILNYLLNISFFLSKETDSRFSFKKKDNNFLFFFKNINYFLCLNSSNFSK